MAKTEYGINPNALKTMHQLSAMLGKKPAVVSVSNGMAVAQPASAPKNENV